MIMKKQKLFVPNYIINKLPPPPPPSPPQQGEGEEKEQEQEEYREDHIGRDKYFRQKRNYYLNNPIKRDTILAEMRKQVVHKEVRRLFDCLNKYNTPDTPLTIEEQIHSTKPSLNEALQLANVAYDFYHDKYQLESFDNRSSPIDLHIHYGEGYNNAFYDGLRFTFGDGDGIYFKTFLLQDIFMHELTHGVTDHKVGLPYENQQGAISEHLSDVFGMALKQRLNREKATKASWIVGEGLFTNKVNGVGIRTFKNEPAYNDNILGLDDAPKHMKDYMELPNDDEHDYGGVHLNGQILNHAFYRFCVSAELDVSDEWNNRSWKSPLEIWYNSYNFMKPSTNFEQFAKITLQVAKDDHPELQTQLFNAWIDVGLKV